ncbi:hypothetical protein [Agrobacterium sp. NPDC089420]|uniref:hypothetical protein n=1 Tax=Agrobacterium sp. NPDC089420 TaxID=3363918 RepID=UPI00384A5B22
MNGNSVLNPLDFFTITFPSNVPATTRYIVLSLRDAGLQDGDALMKQGNRVVKGPNAAQIASAEGFAEEERRCSLKPTAALSRV